MIRWPSSELLLTSHHTNHVNALDQLLRRSPDQDAIGDLPSTPSRCGWRL